MKIVEKSAPAPKVVAPKVVAPKAAGTIPTTLDELKAVKGFGAKNIAAIEQAIMWGERFGKPVTVAEAIQLAGLGDFLTETIAKNSKGKFNDSAKAKIQDRVLADKDLLKAIKYLLYRSGKNAVGMKLYMGKDQLIRMKIEGPFDMNATATPDALFFEPVSAEMLPQLPELFAGLE